MIDKVISFIKDLGNSIEDFPSSDVRHYVDVMEEIRSANSTLRDWGNEMFTRVQELEDDLDYSERQIEKLKDELEQSLA